MEKGKQWDKKSEYIKEFCRWRFTTNNSSNKIQKFLRNHRGASSHCCVMSYGIDHQFLIINDHTKNVYFPVQVWKIQFFCRISLWNVLHHRRLDSATVEVSMSVARRREDTTINHDDMEIFFADARHMYARQFSWWFFLLLLIENFARIS